MKKLLIALVCGVFIAAMFKSDWRPIDPEAQRQLAIYNAKNATVLVQVSDGYGSGVIVSSRGLNANWTTYVWTAGHVMRDTETGDPIDEATVKLPDGREALAHVIGRSWPGDARDVVLMEVETPNWTSNSASFYRGAPPQIGTPVFHVGNFFGPTMRFSFVQGYVSFLDREMKEELYDQIDCPSYPGASGGGFYLLSGQCIGLMIARYGETQSFILPVRQMQAWAKEKDAEFALP